MCRSGRSVGQPAQQGLAEPVALPVRVNVQFGQLEEVGELLLRRPGGTPRRTSEYHHWPGAPR